LAFRRKAMKKHVVFLFALVLVLSVERPARTQETATLSGLKQQAVSEVDKLQVLTQQMVDQIYSYSELGFQEYETSRYVSGLLEKNGFNVERGVAGRPTAWVASYGGVKPVIGFITEIYCIPRALQKPGVAYHDPIIEGAPGHVDGDNS